MKPDGSRNTRYAVVVNAALGRGTWTVCHLGDDRQEMEEICRRMNLQRGLIDKAIERGLLRKGY